MKVKSSFISLLIIILAELAGLASFLYLKHSFELYSNNYEVKISRNYEEKEIINTIRQLVYQHENYTFSLIHQEDLNLSITISNELLDLEIKLRNELTKLGHSMNLTKKEKPEVYSIFTKVNDNVLNYLNYSTVILAISPDTNTEDTNEYLANNISPLIDHMNENIEQLVIIKDKDTYIVQNQMQDQKQNMERIANFSILLLIFGIITSILVAQTTIINLETDKSDLLISRDMKQHRIEVIQNKIIVGIADLIESRSGETGQHVKRTSKYVSLLAQKAIEKKLWPEILDEKYKETIVSAAPLHDIGKIVIPDHILNKPGKLTEEEFSIMKAHAAAGGKIVNQLLNGIEDMNYIQVASDIANFHHERWDGSGYPLGLKGTDIPLSARFMALADVFDALVSKRCYKEVMSYQEAFDIIQNESGKHFDPDVAQLFLELKDEICKNEK